MLNVKPERPLSESLLALIRVLDGVAKQLDISYFIIGATARDILMEHVHGLDTARATKDIDFAVAVSSWEEYEQLKTALTATGKFLAWNDRTERDKDASDVYLILRTYHDAGQAERLYDDAFDLLEGHGYEVEPAGAALLGRHARRDIAAEARAQVMNVLANERKLDKFSAQMARSHSGDIDHATRLIKAFIENLG